MSFKQTSNLNRNWLVKGIRFAFLPTLLICLIFISMLAGCQLQNILLATATALTPQPTQGQTSVTTPEPQETAPTANTATVQTKLVLWVPPEFDPSKETQAAKLFSDRVAAFQSLHPEVLLEVRVKALEGRGGLLDSITTASSAAPKGLPALVLLSSDDVENAALKELLLPLDGVYKNFDDTDWLPYASGLARIEDSNYGVPIAGDALVMAYRPLQSPFPPTTWQELALQDQVVSFPAADEDALVATTLYLAANGKLIGETGIPILQKTPLLKAYAIMNDGIQAGVFPFWLSQFTSFDQSWLAFKNQQAGYSINWVSQFLKDQPANVSINLVPKIGSTQVSLARGWVWCIPSQSMNQSYSTELLLYFSDADFINAWGQAAGYIPVRQSGLTQWQNNELLPVITSLAQNAQILPSINITHITNPILETSLVQIIKKQVYYQQAIDDAVKNFAE